MLACLEQLVIRLLNYSITCTLYFVQYFRNNLYTLIFFSDDKPEIQDSKINLEPLGSTDTQRRQKSVTGHHFSTDCRLLVILPAQEALIGTKTSRVVSKLQVDC